MFYLRACITSPPGRARKKEGRGWKGTGGDHSRPPWSPALSCPLLEADSVRGWGVAADLSNARPASSPEGAAQSTTVSFAAPYRAQGQKALCSQGREQAGCFYPHLQMLTVSRDGPSLFRAHSRPPAWRGSGAQAPGQRWQATTSGQTGPTALCKHGCVGTHTSVCTVCGLLCHGSSPTGGRLRRSPSGLQGLTHRSPHGPFQKSGTPAWLA